MSPQPCGWRSPTPWTEPSAGRDRDATRQGRPGCCASLGAQGWPEHGRWAFDEGRPQRPPRIKPTATACCMGQGSGATADVRLGPMPSDRYPCVVVSIAPVSHPKSMWRTRDRGGRKWRDLHASRLADRSRCGHPRGAPTVDPVSAVASSAFCRGRRTHGFQPAKERSAFLGRAC